jgi:hypothetical protein
LRAIPPANQRRILDACPHVTEVRTFHGWLAPGGVVMKGQKGIRLVATDTKDDGKITSIKPVSVFDATQTQERTARAAQRRKRAARSLFRAALAIIA